MAGNGDRREIVVIGGGIIGCSTAYFLTRHPAYKLSKDSITIIEASEIAGGASGKAGGLLALWAYPKNIVPLSFRLHAELAAEHGGEKRWGYRRIHVGQLTARGRPLTSSDKQDARQENGETVSLQKRSKDTVTSLKAAGVPKDLDWFLGDSLQSYDEMGDPETTAQVHPYQFTTSMAELAQDGGAKTILGSVTKIEHSNNRVKGVAYTNNETGQSHVIPATDVIISAGPWTRNVWPQAPISAVRAHSITIRPTRPVSAYAIFSEILLPQGFSGIGGRPSQQVSPEIYARPNNEVYICSEGDTSVPLPATSKDVETDDSRCQAIVDAVSTISDELRNGEVTVRQACYLPQVESAMGGPIIGAAGIKGLFLAAGHTCWGIQNAPATGKLISECVFDGKAKSANISQLAPKYFF